MNILNIEPICYNDEAKALLDELGKVNYQTVKSEKHLGDLLTEKSYDVLMVGLGVYISQKILKAAKDLKWIVTPTTGLTHIDLDAAKGAGIEVVSLKGETDFLETIHTTAEHCWGLLLSLVRFIPKAHSDIVEGGYWRRSQFLGRELSGKTLGIIGCGRLGRKVATYGLAFGMNVSAYEISDESKNKSPKGVQFISLDSLLANSDIVSLHIPCNKRTEGFFSRDCIEKMKEKSFFINTARGELVDENALYDAVEIGKISGVALDVLQDDSSWTDRIPEDNKWLSLVKKGKNILLTPHIGGYSQEPVEKTRFYVAKKLLKNIENTK